MVIGLLTRFTQIFNNKLTGNMEFFQNTNYHNLKVVINAQIHNVLNEFLNEFSKFLILM